MIKILNLCTPISDFLFQLALWGIYTPIYSCFLSIHSVFKYDHLGTNTILNNRNKIR